MHWSKYNYLFCRDGLYFLYNSYTNNFVELSEEDFNLLRRCSSGDMSELDDESREYLQQQYVLVNSDDDLYHKVKFQRTRARYNSKILALTIAPTLGCNFKCPYCYEVGRAPQSMDKAVIEGLYKFIAEFPDVDALRITWYGGEPLLMFPLIKEISQKLIRDFPDYQASMITNGYLLNEEICKMLSILKIRQIQITLDGLEDTHNQRRPHRIHNDSFQRIISNLELLFAVDSSISVALRVNTDISNQNEFLPLYRFLNEKFRGQKLHVHPGYVTDTFSVEKNQNCMSSCDKINFLLKLREDNVPVQVYPRSEYGECTARHINSFVIGPKGELYKCWNDIGIAENTTGSIFDFSFGHATIVKYMLKADPLSSEECKECFLFPVCCGGCPYMRINSLQENNPETCKLYKHHIEDFLYTTYLHGSKNNS